jgi:hypothetical protein
VHLPSEQDSKPVWFGQASRPALASVVNAALTALQAKLAACWSPENLIKATYVPLLEKYGMIVELFAAVTASSYQTSSMGQHNAVAASLATALFVDAVNRTSENNCGRQPMRHIHEPSFPPLRVM